MGGGAARETELCKDLKQGVLGFRTGEPTRRLRMKQPGSVGTEAPVLRTLSDLDLCIPLPECSTVSFKIPLMLNF